MIAQRTSEECERDAGQALSNNNEQRIAHHEEKTPPRLHMVHQGVGLSSNCFSGSLPAPSGCRFLDLLYVVLFFLFIIVTNKPTWWQFGYILRTSQFPLVIVSTTLAVHHLYAFCGSDIFTGILDAANRPGAHRPSASRAAW